MAAVFDPSLAGIFIFGLLAGICPCNSVICLGLIGYLTSGKTTLTLPTILKLVLASCTIQRRMLIRSTDRCLREIGENILVNTFFGFISKFTHPCPRVRSS